MTVLLSHKVVILIKLTSNRMTRMRMRVCMWSLLLLCVSINSMAQVHEIEKIWDHQLETEHLSVTSPQSLRLDTMQLLDIYNKIPSFGIYHDNYFTTGAPTNKKINKNTADAKFQISIRQRLSKNLGFLNTSLMLTYTQKSFWDVYKYSAPFSENNYNPALVFTKLIVKNNKIKGIGVLSIEHESNGRDSIESRSWNYMTLSGVLFYNYNIYVQAKVWAGLMAEENPDLLDYKGHGLLAVNYRTTNGVFWASAIISPRDKFRSYNTTLELNFRPGKAANQYFFLQWYNGYAENLAEYKTYSSMVRIGICMKPTLRSFY